MFVVKFVFWNCCGDFGGFFVNGLEEYVDCWICIVNFGVDCVCWNVFDGDFDLLNVDYGFDYCVWIFN